MAQPETEKIILGIDPGTNVMGYGVIKVVGKKASMVAMGIIDLRKVGDAYLRLGHIFERVTGIIDAYLPDELAIEAPFFGKNVQSMLKLGRAQGVAIDGHHWTGAGFQRAGGRYAETPITPERRGDAQIHGCHRRTRGRLLPLLADGKTRNRHQISRLERLRQ